MLILFSLKMSYLVAVKQAHIVIYGTFTMISVKQGSVVHVALQSDLVAFALSQ